MPYPNMDALFYLASQGSEEAKKDLHNIFKIKAVIAAKKISKNYPEFQGNCIDIDDFSMELLLRVINEYDADRCSFSWYTQTFLDLKIESYLFSYANRLFASSLSLDNEVEDEGVSYVECIESPDDRNMENKIAIEQFKYQISSPQNKFSNREKLKNKIMLLKYGGLKDKEIKEKLNLKDGLFRQLTKEIYNDDEIINLKMELK